MEFNFNIEKILDMIPGTSVGFLDARTSYDMPKEKYNNLCILLDTIGNYSAKVSIFNAFNINYIFTYYIIFY